MKKLTLPANFKISDNINDDFNKVLLATKCYETMPTELKEWFYQFGKNVAFEVPRIFGGMGYTELQAFKEITEIEKLNYQQLAQFLNVSKAASNQLFGSDEKYLEYLRIEEIVIKQFNDNYKQIQDLVKAKHSIKQNVLKMKQGKK